VAKSGKINELVTRYVYYKYILYIYNIRVFGIYCTVLYIYIVYKFRVKPVFLSRLFLQPGCTQPQHPQEVLLGESHMWIKVCKGAAVQASSFQSQWVHQAAFRLISKKWAQKIHIYPEPLVQLPQDFRLANGLVKTSGFRLIQMCFSGPHVIWCTEILFNHLNLPKWDQIVCQNIQFTQLRSSVAVMNNIQDVWNHQIEDVTNENTDLANKNGDVNKNCVSAYFTNAGV